MKYSGEENKIGGVVGAIRVVLLLLIAIAAYGMGIFPALLFPYMVLKFINLQDIFLILVFSLLLVIDYLILVFSLLFSSAFFINIFRLKYDKEGVYRKTLDDKMAFKFTAYFALYYPVYKLINLFSLPPIKSFYLRLIGAKIGKNVFLAGEEWLDPCLLEIGDNTMIGGRAMILGHIAEEKLILKKTKIGKNCLVGGETFIMPGVVIEDNVVLGAKSFVPKDMHLKKGKTYVGIPARELK
jgi:acetyltransferase-like isoleucine patch superfamily enzyme